MTQIIKEVNGTEGTRSSFPDITEQFRTIANWNTYTQGDKITSDKGVKYEHQGVVMSAILLKKKLA